MSTWYDYHITATGSKESIAKFFNIEPEKVNHIDDFEFSFSAKNGAVPNLDEIEKKNPGLIFITQQNIESDTENWYLSKFDEKTQEHKYVAVEHCTGYDNQEFNKRILEKYMEEHPKYKHGDNIGWNYFLSNFELSSEILDHAHEYEQMISALTDDDFLSDDFSHLMFEDE
jgi:hypothetical protein